MFPDGVRNSPPVAVCIGTNVLLEVGVGGVLTAGVLAGAVVVAGALALVRATVGAAVMVGPPGDAEAGPPSAAGEGLAGGAVRPFGISLIITSETASTITAAMAVSGAAHRGQRRGARRSARSSGRGASRSGGA